MFWMSAGCNVGTLAKIDPLIMGGKLSPDNDTLWGKKICPSLYRPGRIWMDHPGGPTKYSWLVAMAALMVRKGFVSSSGTPVSSFPKSASTKMVLLTCSWSGPDGPVAPVGPGSPVTPVGPVGPRRPCGPGGPPDPTGPRCPWG